MILFKPVKRFKLLQSAFAILTVIILTSHKAESPKKSEKFFDGKSLKGWSSTDMSYWSVRDGAIVGHSSQQVARNEFLWSKVKVKDFYLSVDILLEPDGRNAGIQFRSKRADKSGQALGYQADVGQGVWGKLYHEHGRKKLDWTNRGEKAVKKGQWNRYEILAVGHKIWTAINGTLSVAVQDPSGELAGYIAFQIHSGDAQTVKYKINELIHNPPIKLGKLTSDELHKQLKPVLSE
jgi:hypothetical protein